jgi:hypothetical protein
LAAEAQVVNPMKTIKRWFGAIGAYFTSGQAARQAQAAMELIG